jgi:hypothetical protein
MGTIVCQNCEVIIAHFECEKSGILYGVCSCCGNKEANKEEEEQLAFQM